MNDQLTFLELELKMLQENIQRVRRHQKLYKDDKWRSSNAAVIGELKHRMMSLKLILTIVGRITTDDLWEKEDA